MAINIDTLINEIESAVRGNLHNYDNMFAAVSAIFHRDLDGRTSKEQNSYLHWFMGHFGSKKYWLISFPTARRLQLMSALILGRKFRDRSVNIEKLVSAGEAVLKMDIGSFKACFAIIGN